MRRDLLFLILLLCGTVIIQAQSTQYIDRERAWEIVKDEILKGESDSIFVYVSKDTKKANSLIATIYKPETTPSFESWFIFIDDEPLSNWEHPCRYIFVDVKDGHYEIRNMRRPPSEDMDILVQFNPSKSSSEISTAKELNVRSALQTYSDTLPAYHNYAVIISGGGNLYSNWDRYWNDCSEIYKTLIEKYHYPKDNIYVIMSDGTSPELDRRFLSGGYDSSPLDLDGDGFSDIQYAATKANISSVFNQLSNTLTENDDLFVFTIDHGGLTDDGHTLLYLWNNEYITDTELAVEFNKVNAGHVMVCMGQCNSGGFINYLQGNNKVIATACSKYETSKAMTNGIYDEFVYHWTSAVRRMTPTGNVVNANTNYDNIISMYEAFVYSENNDTRDETPQYSSTPTLLGKGLSLAPDTRVSISGSSVLCGTQDYYVSNLPTNAIVTWNLSVNSNNPVATLSSDTPAVNRCRISRNETSFSGFSAVLTANVTYQGDTITELSKNLYGHTLPELGLFIVTNIDTGQSQVSHLNQNNYATLQPNVFYHVESTHLPGMTLIPMVSPSFMPGLTFRRIDDNTLEIMLPQNGYLPVYAIGGGCYEFYMVFGTASGGYSMTLDSTDRQLHVMLAKKADQQTEVLSGERQESFFSDNPNWTLEIYKASISQRMVSRKVSGNDYTLDTSSWEKGIYIVRAMIEDEVLTEKITIK